MEMVIIRAMINKETPMCAMKPKLNYTDDYVIQLVVLIEKNTFRMDDIIRL